MEDAETSPPGDELLASSALFAGLDRAQRTSFLELASIVEIDRAGAIIVREGQDAENFYVILEGTAEVVKQEGEREFLITTLGPGDHFGETALFRQVKRTATIRSTTPMRLAMIHARQVRRSPTEHQWLAPVLLEIVRRDNTRLDRLTNQTVVGLRSQTDNDNRLRALNRLLTFAILSLSIYAITSSFTLQFVTSSFVSSVLTNGLYLVLGAVLIWIMITSPYPLEFFGLRRADDRKRELVETLAATAGFMALLAGLKLVLIHTVPSLRGFELFAPTETPFVEFVFFAFYLVFMPIQEMCVRGALQSSLEEVFRGHGRGTIYAILLSNALFAAVHSHLSPYFAIAMFVPGVMWGVLYTRHRSLLGVSISHVIIGVWALRLLRFDELIATL